MDQMQNNAIIRGQGRPATYKTKNGKRVPGVTTILGRWKESGGLLHWAHGIGYEQGEKGLSPDLYAKRDEAADVGTLIHSLIEADIHGEPHPSYPAAFESRVISGYSAWRDWLTLNRCEFYATEVPLVSEQYGFGGTIDVVLRMPNGGLSLCDWKSSAAVYADYLIQLAAYRQLWEENGHEPITEGFNLFRFSKDHGDFEHRRWPELAEAWELFKHLRAAYDLDRAVKARCK